MSRSFRFREHLINWSEIMASNDSQACEGVRVNGSGSCTRPLWYKDW